MNQWIATEGKPAEERAERLQVENEGLQLKLSKMELEFNAIKSELVALTEEKQSLQDDYTNAVNRQNSISQQLQVKDEELAKATESLKIYDDKVSDIELLKAENESLRQKNQNLKLENDLILDRNKKFELKNNSLQDQLNGKDELIEDLNGTIEDSKKRMVQLRQTVEEQADQINLQNEEIDNLKEKMSLFNQGDTSKLITESMGKTLHEFQATSKGIADLTGYDNTATPGVGFYDSNITSPGFNETIHGFYASGTQHDIVADTQPHTRGKSQSIVESDHTLQAQIFEYIRKEKEWEDERKLYEEEKVKLEIDAEKLQNEKERLQQKVSQLERNNVEERSAHEIEMRRVREEQNNHQQNVSSQKTIHQDIMIIIIIVMIYQIIINI